jgi:hypothetical protein
MDVCAFCLRTNQPISPEDVWPRWLSKYLRQSKGNALIQQRMEWIKSGRIETESNIQRARVEAEVVCKECNNGWMSQVEAEVKPILIRLIEHPSSRGSVTDEEAVLLASWMILKGIVLDHFMLAHGQTSSFFTARQRTSLMKKAMPPDNVAVWLARLPTPASLFKGDFTTLYYPKFAAGANPHLQAYVFTLGVNEVGLQLIALRNILRKPVGAPPPFANRPMGRPWSDVLHGLWPAPIPPSFALPLPQLGEGGFDFFSYRLGGVPSQS